MTEPTVIPRRPDEPAPDLTDYFVVHRAMTTDLRRLVVAAAELVQRHDEARLRALRRHLAFVSHEIESHHHVEDDAVWPVLVTAAGERAALVELTGEHDELDPLLHRAAVLASRPRATPELAATLDELSGLLDRHIRHEEESVFPLITEFLRVEDYRRLQARFRSNLRPGMLPLLVPWVVNHATPEERATLLGEAPWVFRLLHALFRPRFRRHERLLFG